MPAHKEPNYFIADGEYWNTPQSLEEYLALFAAAQPGQLLGEASILYLASTTAADGIATVAPRAKMIAILREPGSLLRSYHLQMLQSRVETEQDLRRALALEDARREGRHPPRSGPGEASMLFYSNHVRYVEQLRRFHDRFPPAQLLVLIYDDFRADNAGVLGRILRFLEVDEGIELVARRSNPTVQVRSPRIDQFVRAVSKGEGRVSRVAKRGIKAVTPQRLRRRGLSTFESRLNYRLPPNPDEELLGELRDKYRPEVEALSDYLERDLISLWGYEP
jgi:hypothetical protein